MGFLSGVANFFRTSPKAQKTDRYGILSPLLATGDYISQTSKTISALKGSVYADTLKGRVRTSDPMVTKAVKSYQDYVKHLPVKDRAMEKDTPFSSILVTLDNIKQNTMAVEDNFQKLFGELHDDEPEKHLKASSLFVIGYVEKASDYCTWLSTLIEHLTHETGSSIAPFRSREMENNAADAAAFAAKNTTMWDSRHGGFIADVGKMQTKGSDYPMQAGSGEWIDQYAADSQFSYDEQNLITASFRSPIMYFIGYHLESEQFSLQLLETKKEFLIARTIQIDAKLRGMDPNSQEYKKLQKVTDRYASLVSKYEQRIERLRS